MHEILAGRMVSFHFAVDAKCFIAVFAIQLHLQRLVNWALAQHLWLLRDLSPCVLVSQFVMVVIGVTLDTKICLLGLTIFTGCIVLAQFTDNLLLKLSVPLWIDIEMNNVLWQNFCLRVINYI